MARKCTYCRAEIPRKKDCDDPAQRAGFCNYDHMAQHGIEKARRQKERQHRQETKAAKERIKTKGEHLKEAQSAFNAYIRARDAGLPCISCGRTPDDQDLLTGSRWDAGHYRSTGACPELRFEPLNCHKQCVKCNRNLSGNAVEYRIRLVKRIGQEAVDWLEQQHPAKRYSIEDLKEIKAHYRKLKREIDKSQRL